MGALEAMEHGSHGSTGSCEAQEPREHQKPQSPGATGHQKPWSMGPWEHHKPWSTGAMGAPEAVEHGSHGSTGRGTWSRVSCAASEGINLTNTLIPDSGLQSCEIINVMFRLLNLWYSIMATLGN